MIWTQFIQDVGNELDDLLHRRLPWSSGLKEVYAAQRRLQSALAALTTTRARLRALAARQAGLRAQERRLAQRIEIYLNVADRAKAYQLALRLDQLRENLHRDRAYLVELGKLYSRQIQEARARRRELSDVQQQLEEYA